MTSALVHQPAAAPEELSDHQWAALERRAEKLSKVSYIPEAFRGKPDDIMAVGLALAAMGKPLTPLTLKLCYVVNGTVDYMYQLYSALVHEHGHSMWVTSESDESATVAGQRAGEDRVHEVTFTIADARKAGLVERNPTYKKYARDMLVARAGKRVAKRIAPEAILGLPPPPVLVPGPEGRPLVEHRIEEDEDVVDAELVDPESGEVVGSVTSGAASSVAPVASPPHSVPQERRVALRRSIKALDDEERKLAYALAKQRSLPSLDGPHFMTADADALAACIRQARALVACQRAGVTTDDGRHDLIREATEGATESSQNLDDDQLAAVLAYCDGLASEDA